MAPSRRAPCCHCSGRSALVPRSRARQRRSSHPSGSGAGPRCGSPSQPGRIVRPRCHPSPRYPHPAGPRRSVCPERWWGPGHRVVPPPPNPQWRWDPWRTAPWPKCFLRRQAHVHSPARCRVRSAGSGRSHATSHASCPRLARTARRAWPSHGARASAAARTALHQSCSRSRCHWRNRGSCPTLRYTIVRCWPCSCRRRPPASGYPLQYPWGPGHVVRWYSWPPTPSPGACTGYGRSWGWAR